MFEFNLNVECIVDLTGKLSFLFSIILREIKIMPLKTEVFNYMHTWIAHKKCAKVCMEKNAAPVITVFSWKMLGCIFTQCYH